MRRAQLIAESVAVCCPYCGEPQLNRQGSEMWTAQDFIGAPSRIKCNSCDETMSVSHESKATFSAAPLTS